MVTTLAVVLPASMATASYVVIILKSALVPAEALASHGSHG
jgi:hypothetical protein